MKRYIKASDEQQNVLEAEAQRVYDGIKSHPEVQSMDYVEDTDAYCIHFDNNAEDVGWIWDAMEKLGYKSTSQDEDAIYWGKGKDFRAWMFEEPDLELYITR